MHVRGRSLVQYGVILAALFASLSLSGCRVGPEYRRPVTEVPADWHWKKAQLLDAAQNGAEWWQVFKDPRLDQVETAALQSNLDIRLALARVEEARALARLSRAD